MASNANGVSSWYKPIYKNILKYDNDNKSQTLPL